MGRKRLDDLRASVSELFELPKEITLNWPKIIMIGTRQMLVENHKGVIEYTPVRIRVNSAVGVIRIAGKDLKLKTIAVDDIFITGDVEHVEFK